MSRLGRVSDEGVLRTIKLIERELSDDPSDGPPLAGEHRREIERHLAVYREERQRRGLPGCETVCCPQCKGSGRVVKI